MNLKRWFAQIWPSPEARRETLEQYRLIGGFKFALADIALRGGVYSVDPAPAANLYEAGVREGRRQCALEIIKICEADPRELYGLVERKPRHEEPNR